MNKTKFFIAILFLAGILITGILKVSAYSGTASRNSPPCDNRATGGQHCVFVLLAPNGSQAWKGNVTGHLEGHGAFGPAGGRGIIAGCINSSGAANSGSCWWDIFPDTKVGDGRIDMNASRDIGQDYNPAFNKFYVDFYANDATWDPLSVTVFGRKVEIISPVSNINATQDRNFTVPWNVQYGQNTVFFYDGAGISCDVGGSGVSVNPSGSATCSASGVGGGEITISSEGPSGSGIIHTERTISVTVAPSSPGYPYQYEYPTPGVYSYEYETPPPIYSYEYEYPYPYPYEYPYPYPYPTPYYSVTVVKTNGGTVKSTDNIINCGGTCSHDYIEGSSVILNATPNSSYWKFTGWSGDCSNTTGSCNLNNITSPKTVTPSFILRRFQYFEF